MLFVASSDEDGPYYWHIKTGTIQREPPSPPLPEKHLEVSGEPNDEKVDTKESSAKKEKQQEHHLQEFENHAFKYATESIKSL